MLNVSFKGGATVFEYREKESPALARIRARQPEIRRRALELQEKYGDPVERLAELLGRIFGDEEGAKLAEEFNTWDLLSDEALLNFEKNLEG